MRSTFRESAADQAVFCAPGCKWVSLGNGVCDQPCRVAACSFDYTDCGPRELAADPSYMVL